MIVNDAIKILNISEMLIDAVIIKGAYRKASLKYHPDHNPAGTEMMKLINEAKEVLSSSKLPITVNENGSSSYDYGAEINNALNKIIIITDLNIEVCGSWVWISGETKEHKDTLKDACFKYSGKKKMWYFRPQSEKKRWRGGKEYSMSDIRNKYNSDKVKTKKVFSLPAHA